MEEAKRPRLQSQDPRPRCALCTTPFVTFRNFIKHSCVLRSGISINEEGFETIQSLTANFQAQLKAYEAKKDGGASSGSGTGSGTGTEAGAGTEPPPEIVFQGYTYVLQDAPQLLPTGADAPKEIVFHGRTYILRDSQEEGVGEDRMPVLEREVGGTEGGEGVGLGEEEVQARPPSPGVPGSPLSEPLGESQLQAFKRQHYFVFSDRVVFVGARSASFSAGLNGDLSVENILAKIKLAYRELNLRNQGSRCIKLGMYFSAILRTEEGFRYYSPSFNTSITKNQPLFVITCSNSYERIGEYLRRVPIVERLSVAWISKTGGAAIESHCSPFTLSFFCILNLYLNSQGLLGEYCPRALAECVIVSLGVGLSGSTSNSFFHVSPESFEVFEHVCQTFGLKLDILLASGDGMIRSFYESVGDLKAERLLCMAFVTDEAKFLGERRSEGRKARAPFRGRVKQERELLSAAQNRWVWVRDARSWTSSFECSLGCGGVFQRPSALRDHERVCPFDPLLPQEEQSFVRLVYAEKEYRPRLKLSERLGKLGISVPESLFWTPHMSSFDTESEQSSLQREGEEEGGATGVWTQLTLPMYSHALFCISFCFTSSGQDAESHVLFRARYLDAVSLVWDFVGELVRFAQLQREVRLAKCEHLILRLKDEAAKADKAGKPYFANRLNKCLRDVLKRCGTVTLLGFNNAKFDTALLSRAGFLAVLRSLFPSLEILKKGRNYQAIDAWCEEEGIGLRIVDQLRFLAPTSLAKFISSNMGLLPGDFQLPKTHLPFFALHKVWTRDWQEAEVNFVYEDFVDMCLGGNLLNREWADYEGKLREWEGDSEGALKALGLSCPPKTGPQLFAQLAAEWEAANLRTALQVTTNYAAVDVIPLALIASKRSQQILADTDIDLYTSFSSISSYAFAMLARSALSEPQPMSFQPLGPRLGKLLRRSVRGGLSFLANRYMAKGMPIPRPTLSPADTPLPSTHRCEKIIQLDSNSMYPYAEIKAGVLTGRPILREPERQFRAMVGDDRRKTMNAEMLGLLSLVLDSEGRVAEIECEFSGGGETYVSMSVPEGSARAAHVQVLYDATISVFEAKERLWLQRTSDPRPAPSSDSDGARFSSDDDGPQDPPGLAPPPDEDQDSFVVSDQEDQDPELLERQLEGLSGPAAGAHPYSEGSSLGAVAAVANLRNLAQSSVHLAKQSDGGRRRRISSGSESSVSSEDSATELSAPPTEMQKEPKKEATTKPSQTKGSFSNWKRLGYLRFRIDGRVTRLVERSESGTTRGDWWSGSTTPSPVKGLATYSLTAAERQHLFRHDLEPWIVERVETTLGIVLPPKPPPPAHPKGTIVELLTCCTNHLGCQHSECSAREWTETELFEKSFFSKSFARVVVEDCFRLRCLQLDYEVVLVWTCAYRELVRETESDVAAFSKAFQMAPSKFPLNATLTEAQIVEGIGNGKIDGIVTCDVAIPEHKRLAWSEFPPVIKPMELDNSFMLQPFKDYARFLGYMESSGRRQRFLCGSFEEKAMTTTTYYLRTLVEAADAQLSRVTLLCEFQRSFKLKSFVDSNIEMRKEGDRTGDKLKVETGKLLNNSSFGFSLIDRSRYNKTRLTDSTKYERQLRSSKFVSADNVGRPGAREGELLELSLRPTRVREEPVILLGNCVLAGAKALLIQFIAKLIYFFVPGSWGIMGGDTDSAQIIASAADLDDLVRPELRSEWAEAKSSIFVTCPEDARTLGLWKVEAEGSSSVYASNKLYSLVNEETKTVKKAARGAQMKSSNADLLCHASYLEAIQRPQAFADYVEQRGLVVLGKGRLGTLEEEGGSQGSPSPLSPSQSRALRQRSLDRGAQFHAWQEAEEKARLEAKGIRPRPMSLLAQNMLITRNTDNVLVSIVAHKSLMSGMTGKRLLLPGSYATCPIPETEAMQVAKD